MSWSIIVHGGAGAIDARLSEPHQAGCREATTAGAKVLEAGGSSEDAVIAATHVLEDNPIFNAGIGSAVDAGGLVQTDAAIFRGRDLGYGAVGAVAGVRHPIDLARKIMHDGRHAFLVGAGAVDFAREVGVELVDPKMLEADPSRSRWWFTKAEPTERGNTVGAVARDIHGDLCAATSTGGILRKLRGRVGDSPVAGAGTYASNALGALSATGHGETLLRTVFAYRALEALAASQDAPGATLKAQLDWSTAQIGGKAGAIVVLPDGTTAYATNTAHMGVAWMSAESALESAF